MTLEVLAQELTNLAMTVPSPSVQADPFPATMDDPAPPPRPLDARKTTPLDSREATPVSRPKPPATQPKLTPKLQLPYDSD